MHFASDNKYQINYFSSIASISLASLEFLILSYKKNKITIDITPNTNKIIDAVKFLNKIWPNNETPKTKNDASEIESIVRKGRIS